MKHTFTVTTDADYVRSADDLRRAIAAGLGWPENTDRLQVVPDPFSDEGGGLSQALSPEPALPRPKYGIFDFEEQCWREPHSFSDEKVAQQVARSLANDEYGDACDYRNHFVAAFRGEPLPWRPVNELRLDGGPYDVHGDGQGFLVRAPELYDADCNVHGVGMAYFQDGAHERIGHVANPEEIAAEGAWLACKWNMTNDEWHEVHCRPTHYLRLNSDGSSR